MSSPTRASSLLHCRGPIRRRGFMPIGLSGFATLSEPGLMRLRAKNTTKPPQEKDGYESSRGHFL